MADIFVDQSATFNGDGTIAAQAASGGAAGAFNTFVSVSPSISDKVWIRRTATTVPLTAGQTLSVASVAYIGWPISTDPDYGSRPAGGTSAGWDSDVITYAEFKCSTVLVVDYFIITGAGVRLERLKLTANYVSATTNKAVVDQQANSSLNNCYLLYTGATASSTVSNVLRNSTGVIVTKISSTVIEMSASLSGTGTCTLFLPTLASDWEFINCTLTYSGTPTNVSIRAVLVTAGVSGRLTFAGCTFNRNGTAQTAAMLDLGAGSPPIDVAMYDVTLTDNSTSATSSILILSTSTTSKFIGHRLKASKGCKISGGIVGMYMHWETFTQTVASGTFAIATIIGATYVFNNFTEVTGNTSGAIDGSKTCTILLQNTMFISASPFGTTASILADIFIADAGGTYGNWQFQNANGMVSAQAVTRTGGESYSIKFNMTAGSQNFLGKLQAIKNGFETILASLTTSNTTITIFGAYKGYSPVPDKSQIWADADYLDAGSGAHRAFATSRDVPGVVLTSDTSTWTGDTGLTAFKMVITVAPGQNCLAPIRIFDNLRQASAYFYIDPKPVVT